MTYVAGPNEPVASFALVSTIMPYAAGARSSTYRMALALGLAVPVVFVALGLIPAAVVSAALVVPTVCLLYLYDVNQWEDTPVKVTLLAFGVSALASLGFTLLWREVFFVRLLVPVTARGGEARIEDILVICLLVPVVAGLLMQIGPILLARLPAFDDLMDGFTFGVVSGAAYGAVETLVVHGRTILDDPTAGNVHGGTWLSIIITAAILKPLVYGLATGIAVAEFSGLGEGYDGLKPNYFRGLAEVILAFVAFHLGLYLFGLVDGSRGEVLGMLWAVLVAGVLVLRGRTVLQRALLEGAMAAASGDGESRHATRDVGYCANCELPLLDRSLFCISCGASTRAGSKIDRRFNTAPKDGAPATSGSASPGEAEA